MQQGTILQNDINKITLCADKWLVKFNPSKSESLIIFKKKVICLFNSPPPPPKKKKKKKKQTNKQKQTKKT